MTTRYNFKTLREILNYNDMAIRNENRNSNLGTGISNNTHSNNNRNQSYRIIKSDFFEVNNWNSIFSNSKVFTYMLLMLISILSQLVFSYLAFAMVNVEQSLTIFYLSQLINLITSYILPLSLLKDLDEVLENPFQQLHSEVAVFKQLKFCVIIQACCTLISVIALLTVLNGGTYLESRYDYITQTEKKVDLTTFVRILQIISFQLTLINFILASINLYLAARKIRLCFNRIDKMQDQADLEVLFNSSVINKKFNQSYF